MDIARLTNTAYSTSSYPVPSRNRERLLELVTQTDAVQPVHPTVERVVQGEVLQRQRGDYAATQEYLNSRLFEGSYATDDNAANSSRRSSAGQSSYAVGAYLSHTREFIQPDVNRGKQVDYFI